MNRNAIRLALLLALLLAAGAAIAYVASRYVGLEDLKRNRDALLAMIDARPVSFVLTFMAVFALAASVMPGAAVFKVAAGALFGFWIGMPIALVSTTMAATIGFLIARLAGRRAIEARFGPLSERINAGVEREGVVYLLAMRFNPLMPFFLINVGMGLTRMRARTYIAFTFIGTMPATFVYTNAGIQLGQIEQPSDIISLRIGASLVALSLMPIAGRYAAVWLRRRAAERRGGALPS